MRLERPDQKLQLRTHIGSRVEDFSKMSAMFLPFGVSSALFLHILLFCSADSSSKNWISLVEKSNSFKKLRFRKLKAIARPFVRVIDFESLH